MVAADEIARVLQQQEGALKHAVDCTSHLLTTALTLHRHSWLHSMSLQDSVKSSFEDLPFDGEGHRWLQTM